jgi:hypothetical protein
MMALIGRLLLYGVAKLFFGDVALYIIPLEKTKETDVQLKKQYMDNTIHEYGHPN